MSKKEEGLWEEALRREERKRLLATIVLALLFFGVPLSALIYFSVCG